MVFIPLLLLIVVTGLLAALSGLAGAGRVRQRWTPRAALFMLGLFIAAAAAQDLAVLTHADDQCASDCPDDADGKRCLPNCHSCVCTAIPTRLPTMPEVMPPHAGPVQVVPAPEPPQVFVSSPDFAIFRPPIA